MDISQDVIIDVILNTTGYLAAGGLSIVVYSLFRPRKKATSPVGRISPERSETELDRNENLPAGARQVEFIKFDQPSNNSIPVNNSFTERAGGMAAAARRNRSEVIKLARQMIEAGASADNVRSVLPLAEDELALLCCAKN